MPNKKFKLILIVDDDTIANFINENIIQDLQIAEKVQIETDGLSALRFLVHTKEGDIYPDLILLDLAMPVMDGIEFLEFYSRLAISGKDKIRIIAMWSPGKIKDTKRAQELGIEEFWIKHQIETKLKEVIEKLS